MWSPEREMRAPEGPWIRSRSWDLAFIFGSGVLVALPLATYYGTAWLTGVPPQAFQNGPALGIAMFINLGVAFLIGGPHMYATFTTTLAERSFRERHPWLLRTAAAVPLTVMVLAAWRIELLMALFFAWASVHVVHQLVYLVQQYQRRAASALPAASKLVDYVLAIACLYPIASWRLLAEPGARLQLPLGLEVRAGFQIGRVNIANELPPLLHGQVWIAGVVAAIFGAALLAFVLRSAFEIATGRVVWPRTLLLAITAPVAFALPLFDNMDVALQGFNLWHSVQYIGLVHLMNAYRKQRQQMSSGFVAQICGFGHGARYYVFLVAVSMAAGGLTGVLHYGLGFPLLQSYYCVLLSALWIHYLWDHVVFTRLDALDPVAAPVAR